MIESFEAVILEPHGGDLAGFILIRGSQDKLAQLRSTGPTISTTGWPRAHPMIQARSTARKPCAPTSRTGLTPSTSSGHRTHRRGRRHHRGHQDHRTREAERRRDRPDLRRPLHDSRREDRSGPRVLDARASPRSRGAKRGGSKVSPTRCERGSGPNSGAYLRPALNGADDTLAPLAVWFAMLLALSSLARYHPERWIRALRRDRSRVAIPIEESLDVGRELLPHLVLTHLTQCANGSVLDPSDH